jgi:hypothetical protein
VFWIFIALNISIVLDHIWTHKPWGQWQAR